jgi:hypothetical protein
LRISDFILNNRSSAYLLAYLLTYLLTYLPGRKAWIWVALRGLVAEIYGLVLCVVIGFICGAAFYQFDVDLGWPTEEMSSRGKVRVPTNSCLLL